MTDPQRTIAALIERFPQCFSAADPRPLAIGIYHDLRAAAPKIDAAELAAALAAYVRTDNYLKAMTATRAARVSLSGEPVAHVSKDEAERARRMLRERRER
jgi:sRNA-binding protein